MKRSKVWRILSYLITLASVGSIFGCANYEVNTKRGDIPGYYIRYEMQEADRAVESARQAGKDNMCPVEFNAAENAKNNAYDVFRACHTEEGAALAKKATAQANALCPPKTAAIQMVPTPAEVAVEAPLATIPAAEPTPERMKYCVSLDIEFDINKSDIRPQYHDEVAKVGNFMKNNPTTTAIIEGYTDEVGNSEYNMRLSQQRANSVVRWLVENFAIAPSRLTAKGYGEAKPVASNATDSGKQKNRRIDAIIDCALDVKATTIAADRLCMTLNVEFPTDSADINSSYYDEVNKVGEYMKKYPTTTAVIEGHTDNVGGYEYNMKLSQRRAESVVNFLVDKFGIDRSRLTAKGFGETRRIAYNNTPEGRKQNRRVNAIIDCVIKK